MREKEPVEMTQNESDPHVPLRRSLRRRSTDAERALWRAIRDRQLLGIKFRRQHSVHPYILDFYRAEHNLAVELDGGQHLTPEGLAADAIRAQILANRGIRCLLFTGSKRLFKTWVV